MKKKLLWVVFILLASGATIAAYKPIIRCLEDKPVEKAISFSLYKSSNYASKAYKGSCAEIYITIEKVRDADRTIVWDTTLDAKLLSKYPSSKKALAQKITIPGVVEDKEHLEMNYILTYNSNGSVLKLHSPGFISNGNDTLAITL